MQTVKIANFQCKTLTTLNIGQNSFLICFLIDYKLFSILLPIKFAISLVVQMVYKLFAFFLFGFTKLINTMESDIEPEMQKRH